MRTLSSVTALPAFVTALLASACSSSPSPDTAPTTNAVYKTTFGKYCTATLTTQKTLMLPQGDGWFDNRSAQAAPGTTFLLAAEFKVWAGYLIMTNGTPAKIDANFQTGLAEGTDFTSDCATNSAMLASYDAVLLANATFYPNVDLSGTACTVPAGTAMTSLVYSATLQDITEGQVSSDPIKAQCNLSQAYTRDMSYGDLVTR
jgi:hypothetical protein